MAQEQMTRELIRLLKARFPHLEITLAGARLPGWVLNHGFNANLQAVSAVQSMARKADADYVLVGFIYDFRDRSGGDYGVETPAQIAFELNLIRVRTGRLVWQQHFKERQQPLNENLFQLKKFWRRKGRWVTALQMASSAMEEMISEMAKKYH